ncbi:MAG TPA: DUF192 domain-containing protein [Tepidisphaeraceae bacterium]|jgi:hypothetical protein
MNFSLRFCRLHIALLLIAIGCADTQPTTAPSLPTTQMQIGSKTFALEIARNDADRERGLMRRDSMPADHGMIFVFPKPQMMSFWMKNTRIPLDILYIDADGKVLSIKQMKPYDITPVPSLKPAKYAIELNKDAASGAGVKEGDQLTIPTEAQNASE